MVKLKQLTKAKITVERFGGYDHREVIQDGSWYDERNLASDGFPLMTVRKNRVQVPDIDGVSADSIVAITGKERLVWLDRGGKVWCNGNSVQLYPLQTPPDNPWSAVSYTPWAHISNEEEALQVVAPLTYDLYDHTVEFRLFPPDADHPNYRYTMWYNQRTGEWVENDLDEATIWIDRPMEIGESVYVRVQQVPAALRDGRRRTMVNMGAYVFITPDNLFVNAVKLASGAAMTAGEDYGSVDHSFEARAAQGVSYDLTLQICNQEGAVFTVAHTGDTRPWSVSDGDLWLDTSTNPATMRRWSATLSSYEAVEGTCIKVGLTGIGVGFAKGDGAKFDAFLNNSKWYVNSTLVDDPVLREQVHKLLKAEQYLYQCDDDYVVIPGIIKETEVLVELRYDGDLLVQNHVAMERKAPVMDYVVETGNRLWGCHYGPDEDGQILNEIYACKLGDFKNWRVYQGLSTDSYTASRGSDGPYTGASVLDGHPLFFKRNCVEKVFPSASGAHQIVTQTLDGVQQGSDRSLVVINDRLYYKTDHGIVCYTGAVPQYISEPLGEDEYVEASAGRHLQKYAVSMRRKDEDPLVFVYDTERGVWHVEDEAWYDAPAVTWEDRLYYVGTFGDLWRYGAGDREGVRWYAESGVLGLDVNQRKYISRINLRCRLELGSTATVFVQYNDSGVWQRKGTLWGNRRDTQTLVIWPRRCDTFRLRIEGVGGFALYSITYLRERGSDV